jgi:hypothetical protein
MGVSKAGAAAARQFLVQLLSRRLHPAAFARQESAGGAEKLPAVFAASSAKRMEVRSSEWGPMT